MKEIGPVTEWEVVEYHGTHLVMFGYDNNGNKLIRRKYELQQDETDYMDDTGNWAPLNDLDDGGFPIDATFVAYPEGE